MDKLTVVAWNAINGAPMVFEESALSVIAARNARIKELREALEPLARFVFGAKWIGHMYVERDGDMCVMCGYDSNGNMTGVNIDYSDFERARAALSKEQP